MPGQSSRVTNKDINETLEDLREGLDLQLAKIQNDITHLRAEVSAIQYNIARVKKKSPNLISRIRKKYDIKLLLLSLTCFGVCTFSVFWLLHNL